MGLKESGENYLETILLLHNKNGFVRSVDVALELDYTKASISRAMSILKQNGYITIQKSGQIVLTPIGLEKATMVYERHQIITRFLVEVLAVSDTVAGEDACRIEHIISDESFGSMKNMLNSLPQTH